MYCKIRHMLDGVSICNMRLYRMNRMKSLSKGNAIAHIAEARFLVFFA